jgi:MFS family permease
VSCWPAWPTFAAGTLVCAVAGNLGELASGRVIQGAAGGIYPLAFAIIRDRLPRERVPGGIGLVSSLLGIGMGMYASFLIIPELVQAPARLGYGFGASVAARAPPRASAARADQARMAGRLQSVTITLHRAGGWA